MKKILVVATYLLFLLAIGWVIPDAASAHVRDRDKVALCNSDGSTRKHFHDAGIKLGYYYYIKFDYWQGDYVHYHVWKVGYTGATYDRENKVVDCRIW